MSEERLQAGCITWFGMQYPQYARLLHHSPNGGFRTSVEAAKFKAMGTRAGFPDLFLALPMGTSHGLFIEMKIKGGKLSEKQKEMLSLLQAQGYTCEVCYSFSDFEKCITKYIRNEY